MGTILMMILVAIAVLVAAVAAFWPKDTRTHVVIRGDWRPASNAQMEDRVLGRRGAEAPRVTTIVVADEAHHLKDVRAVRSVSARRGWRRAWGLSGTPIDEEEGS